MQTPDRDSVLNDLPDCCGFAGNDCMDLLELIRVGSAASMPHAHIEVRTWVHYLSQAAGGAGAAREICNLTLQPPGIYTQALAPYLA